MPAGGARLPAHLEASGLIRRVEQAGGFATVLHKGERDAGTILLVLNNRGENQRLLERMPDLDGTRKWHCVMTQDTEKPGEFSEYLDRRAAQDRDIWIIELDVANAERFTEPS